MILSVNWNLFYGRVYHHSRFPPTPPPVYYYTKIHIMPARIILDICKPGCFVSDLLTEIKYNGGSH